MVNRAPRPNPESRRRYARAGISAGVGFLGASMIIAAGTAIPKLVNPDPVSEFADRYTQQGDCLDGTAYDPDNQARINVVDGELYVAPSDPNLVTLWLGSDLAPGDDATTAALGEYCINIPTG